MSSRRNIPLRELIHGTLPAAPILRVADNTIVYGTCTSALRTGR
ncbi:hypothetical protein [Nocardia xishanensis]